jgi:hypothetical protein
MKSDGSIAPLSQVLYRLVEARGLDPKGFMRRAGLDADIFRDPKARVPVRLVDQAFTLATSLIPDPAFGLGAATCWHPSNLGPLGYAWLSSGSLRTALHRLDRYSQVLGSQYRDDCVDEAGGAALCLPAWPGRRGHRAGDDGFHLFRADQHVPDERGARAAPAAGAPAAAGAARSIALA